MRAIVFDLDGTLIDSAPDIQAVANHVLTGEGAAPISLQETRDFVGNGAAIFVQRMMTLRSLPDADHGRLCAAFLATYDDANAHTVLYPGVADALAALKADGFALGICTNKPASAALAVLAHFGLAHLFGSMIGGDSLGVHKPDPMPLLMAFADLNADPFLYVGDSEVDFATSIAAKVPFALFTKGYRKTPVSGFPGALTFSRFADLPALVAQIS